MKSEEFYIGWMPAAPKTIVHHVKKIIIAATIVVAVSGIVLAISQKPFSSANFEFGKLTEIKGIYFNEPVPCLKAVNGNDLFGNPSFITIPLIGFGKSGASGIISNMERTGHYSLNGKELTMKGTLLYNDGKLLMQIDANDTFITHTGTMAGSNLIPNAIEMGEETLHGEIVDPKCFFGVMKPGQGKPHKDCAIRCILGGIPPVLKITDEKGNENYCLLVTEQGKPINEVVKNFVAEPVTIRARAVMHDDWMVLYVKDNGIAPYSYLQQHFGSSIAACGPDCMK